MRRLGSVLQLDGVRQLHEQPLTVGNLNIWMILLIKQEVLWKVTEAMACMLWVFTACMYLSSYMPFQCPRNRQAHTCIFAVSDHKATHAVSMRGLLV